MQKKTLLGLALLSLAVPPFAAAQFDEDWERGPRKPSGWLLVLGAGYAFPTADWAKDLPLDGLVRGVVPLHAELAYRITPGWAVGGFFSYGFGLLAKNAADSCDASGLDCKARPMHAGLQLSYALTGLSRSAVPWVALGAGYEWLRLSGDGTSTLRGPEFKADLGLDFPSGSGRYGPFVTATVAKFNHVSADAGSADIPSDEQGTHAYLTVGLRLLFDL